MTTKHDPSFCTPQALSDEERKAILHLMKYPLLQGGLLSLSMGPAIDKQRAQTLLDVPKLLAKLAPEMAEAWAYGYAHGLSEYRISEMLHLYLRDLGCAEALYATRRHEGQAGVKEHA